MSSKQNSMEQYSHPVRVVGTKLSQIFYMKPRRSKPGRELIINYDKRFPVIDGFEIKYSYYVRFLEKDNVAGNHYHRRKGELFIPIFGDMEVTLEDISTKGQETIILKSSEFPIMHVPTEIAHKVRGLQTGAILLVLATSHADDDDEIDYKVATSGDNQESAGSM